MIKDRYLLKNILIFGIMSVIVLKKKLDCKPVHNKEFLSPKIVSYSDEPTDFDARKIPEAGSNYISWLASNIN